MQRAIRNNPATSAEDIEALEIERERVREQHEGYKTVERIIDQRIAPANIDINHEHRMCVSFTFSTKLILYTVEYLCKWTGLPYSDATWEGYDEVSTIAPKRIEEFLARTTADTVPYKSASYGKGRPHFQKLTGQPSYIDPGGRLKEFQITGLNWLAYRWSLGENCILADEVGAMSAFIGY